MGAIVVPVAVGGGEAEVRLAVLRTDNLIDLALGVLPVQIMDFFLGRARIGEITLAFDVTRTSSGHGRLLTPSKENRRACPKAMTRRTLKSKSRATNAGNIAFITVTCNTGRSCAAIQKSENRK
jgi:hypothetical protein